jgi:hypothetical protein
MKPREQTPAVEIQRTFVRLVNWTNFTRTAVRLNEFLQASPEKEWIQLSVRYLFPDPRTDV